MLTLAVIAKHHPESFHRLINSALPWVREIIVALDDGSDPGISGGPEQVIYFKRSLSGNFSAQRNAICEMVKTDWVLHLDTDENLTDWLWSNIHSMLSEIPKNIDVVLLPRCNIIDGQSKDQSDFINWPDWQPKLHRKHVRWEKPVHEWPAGNVTYWKFHCSPTCAIIHNKTVKDQEAANQLYESILRANPD